MTCPDCGSELVNKASDGWYCGKCGIELDALPIKPVGKAFAQSIHLPTLVIRTDPSREIDALRLGLKYRTLKKDWQTELGFSLAEEAFPRSLKAQAYPLIEKAYEKMLLKEKAMKINTEWNTIGPSCFAQIEHITNNRPSGTYHGYLVISLEKTMHAGDEIYIPSMATLFDIAVELTVMTFPDAKSKQFDRMQAEKKAKESLQSNKELFAYILRSKLQ